MSTIVAEEKRKIDFSDLEKFITEEVRPGLPARFTEASTPGDGIWQGDLGLEIVARVPAGYQEVSPVKQLVPGNTQGARHCLSSLVGVKMFSPSRPSGGLAGPCFQTTRSLEVLHPTHGAVTIPGGLTVLCRYQREWETELARQRRVQD